MEKGQASLHSTLETFGLDVKRREIVEIVPNNKKW